MARIKQTPPLVFRILVALGSFIKFAFLLIIALALLIELSQTKTDPADIPAPAEHPDLMAVAALENAGQHADALTLSTKLLAAKPAFSALERCWLLRIQADIFLSRGHQHLARDAINSCLSLEITTAQKQPLLVWRDQIQQRIDANQAERYLLTSYPNLRSSGFAKQLQGEVVLLYVYLEDRLWQGWSGPQRYTMQQHLEQVTRWYQQQAKAYQQPSPSFDVHYYYVQTGRGISAAWLQSGEFFNEAAPLLLEQMGYRSWQQMRDLMTDNGKKQLAVIFHSNQDNRSFARSCKEQSTDCSIEYVMLTEASLDANRWLVPQVQAHEMAHLFGAADLYNISAAKDYAATDLMNYLSTDLQYAEIAPITAWAIGWGAKPVAPFELEE